MESRCSPSTSRYVHEREAEAEEEEEGEGQGRGHLSMNHTCRGSHRRKHRRSKPAQAQCSHNFGWIGPTERQQGLRLSDSDSNRDSSIIIRHGRRHIFIRHTDTQTHNTAELLSPGPCLQCNNGSNSSSRSSSSSSFSSSYKLQACNSTSDWHTTTADVVPWFAVVPVTCRSLVSSAVCLSRLFS